MRVSIVAAGVICLGLCACASPNEGNPNGAAYLGSPDSTYDAAANPPRANGVAKYNPAAPLPPVLPPADMSGGSAAQAAPQPAR
ncbi:MAG: hypothetical protein JSR25_02475 [Proteobacteria bacterium]|nr:hypothetical protein [Pseudomonadota bacterium]